MGYCGVPASLVWIYLNGGCIVFTLRLASCCPVTCPHNFFTCKLCVRYIRTTHWAFKTTTFSLFSIWKLLNDKREVFSWHLFLYVTSKGNNDYIWMLKVLPRCRVVLLRSVGPVVPFDKVWFRKRRQIRWFFPCSRNFWYSSEWRSLQGALGIGSLSHVPCFTFQILAYPRISIPSIWIFSTLKARN